MQDHSRFLRSDVEIVPYSQRSFLLLNRRTDGYYVLSSEERYLVELLEQGKSPEEIAAAFQSTAGRTITSHHIREFVEQLRRLDMLDEPGEASASVTDLTSEVQPAQGNQTDLAVVDRTPVLHFRFDLITILLGWILHPICIAPALVLVVLGVNVVARHWDNMLEDLHWLFNSYPLWLFVAFSIAPRLLLLNLIHALLVGMTCRQSGGRVRGFALRLWGGILPYFRLDVGDSFILMTPGGRRTVIFLGFWFPIVFGAACAIGWAIARPGSGAGSFWLSFLVPCLFRLVLQANVFFQHGSLYLWLCETTGQWQLLPWAREETRAWLCRRLSPRPLSVRERFWLRLFGLSYYAYRFVSTTAILLAGVYWVVPEYELLGTIFVLLAACWLNRDLLAREPHD